MLRSKINDKHEDYLVVFVLLSLYLSLGESLIPKPFPWMKIGLSNLSTIFVLRKFGNKMALEVVVLRIIIQGLMLGSIFTPGFIISLSSGIISVFCMIFLYQKREKLNIITISMVSGFLHNLVQLIVVYYLLFRNINIFSTGILIFIMFFLLIGTITGGIIGVISSKIKIREVYQ